jgi:hypothetical protein
MRQIVIASLLFAGIGTAPAHATDLAAIIKKVSENCDKIAVYAADAQVRYKI